MDRNLAYALALLGVVCGLLSGYVWGRGLLSGYVWGRCNNRRHLASVWDDGYTEGVAAGRPGAVPPPPDEETGADDPESGQTVVLDGSIPLRAGEPRAGLSGPAPPHALAEPACPSPYEGPLTPAQRRRDRHKRRGEFTSSPARFPDWREQVAAELAPEALAVEEEVMPLGAVPEPGAHTGPLENVPRLTEREPGHTEEMEIVLRSPWMRDAAVGFAAEWERFTSELAAWSAEVAAA